MDALRYCSRCVVVELFDDLRLSFAPAFIPTTSDSGLRCNTTPSSLITQEMRHTNFTNFLRSPSDHSTNFPSPFPSPQCQVLGSFSPFLTTPRPLMRALETSRHWKLSKNGNGVFLVSSKVPSGFFMNSIVTEYEHHRRILQNVIVASSMTEYNLSVND